MPSKAMNALRQLPWLPIFALIFALGIVTFAVFRDSDNAGAPTATPSPTPIPTLATTLPEGPSVVFTLPADNASVSNPVTVAMAIGGGLMFQPEGLPVSPNQGHLWVTVDELPAPGSTLTPADNRVDLADGGHMVTLPDLTPGQHVVRAVWVNSENVVSDPIILGVITINVTVSLPQS